MWNQNGGCLSTAHPASKARLEAVLDLFNRLISCSGQLRFHVGSGTRGNQNGGLWIFYCSTARFLYSDVCTCKQISPLEENPGDEKRDCEEEKGKE